MVSDKNQKKILSFDEMFNKLSRQTDNSFSIFFGEDDRGHIIHGDIRRLSNILIGGTTGSGKSVFIHCLLGTLVKRNSSSNLKLILIDPKQVEFSIFKNVPHLLFPVVYKREIAKNVLKQLTSEINHRLKELKKAKCGSIEEFNDCFVKKDNRMPYILVIIDEFAVLVDCCEEIINSLKILLKNGPSCGVHFCLSTQRPCLRIIPKEFNDYLTTRIAFKTASKSDSVQIIGNGNAEALRSCGEMLVRSPLLNDSYSDEILHVQSSFISFNELKELLALCVDDKK